MVLPCNAKRVKGGLRIDEPTGERWQLALNLVAPLRGCPTWFPTSVRKTSVYLSPDEVARFATLAEREGTSPSCQACLRTTVEAAVDPTPMHPDVAAQAAPST